MKKKLIIFIVTFLVISIAIFSGVWYISYYNKALHPFSGFDKEVLLDYENNEKIKYKEYFEDFFINFVDYKKYEEKYSTDFYYNYRDFLCPTIYRMIYRESDADEGYSYIIKAGGEYENLKKQLLDTVPFVKTPIGDAYKEGCYYIESIELNGWVFKELYFNHSKLEPSFFEKITRRPACWLAYNDNKREITFSYFCEPSLGYFIDEDCLRKYIVECLYM